MGVASKEWVSGMLSEKIDGVLQAAKERKEGRKLAPLDTRSLQGGGQHTLMTLDTPRWRGGKEKRSRLVGIFALREVVSWPATCGKGFRVWDARKQWMGGEDGESTDLHGWLVFVDIRASRHRGITVCVGRVPQV